MPKFAIRTLAFLAVFPLLVAGGGVLAAVATSESCAEGHGDIAASAACGARGHIATAPGDGQERRPPAVSPDPNSKAQPQPPLRATHPCGEDRSGIEERPPSF